MRKSKKELALLRNKLNYHYRYFDKSKISPDPLEFPKRFTLKKDIELSAFISSIFAYGNVVQIIKFLEIIHKIMGEDVYNFIKQYDFRKNSHPFTGLKYRFFTEADIHALFKVLNIIVNEYGSLKKLFLLYYFEEEINIKYSLDKFSKNIIDIWSHHELVSHGAKFMFPYPAKGSTCKRMNLFLRWMVRNDELDFGLWNEIPTSKLVIPVDTHIATISRALGLTHTKSVNWRMAEEITENLKIFNKFDPVKYDFALCHIGMRKIKF